MKKIKVLSFALLPLVVGVLGSCEKSTVDPNPNTDDEPTLSEYKVTEEEWNNFWQSNYPFHIADNYKATMNFSYDNGASQLLTMLIDGSKCKFISPEYEAYLEVLEDKKIKTYSYYSNSWHTYIGTENMADQYYQYFTGYFDYSKFTFDSATKSYKRASANIEIMGDITDLSVKFQNKKAVAYQFRGNAPNGNTGNNAGTMSGEFTYGGQTVNLPPVVDPNPPHIHTFSIAWAFDDFYHWHDATCEHYGEVTSNFGEHIDNNKDNFCDICGKMTGDHVHQYSSDWTTNDSHHWHECTICSDSIDRGEHIDLNRDFRCDVCGIIFAVEPNFDFSISLKSKMKSFSAGMTDKISINGRYFTDDDGSHTYSFYSTNEKVATVDNKGRVYFNAPGKANIIATEENTHISRQLPVDFTVYSNETLPANGFFEYTDKLSKQDYDTRAEITSKLEKYALDTHLGGIPLFEDSQYVRFSDRIELPAYKYVEDYGFGVLTEGRLIGELPNETNAKYTYFYHDYIEEDYLSLNHLSALVDLNGFTDHITSAFWEKRLTPNFQGTEYRPILAADTVRKPIIGEGGEIVGYDNEATVNSAPIPMEQGGSNRNYKKWRIYVKTDGDNGVSLKYRTNSSVLSNYNNRGVALEDYEFIFKLLLTGSNRLAQAVELVRNEFSGIRGALDYYKATQNVTDPETIDNIWNEYVSQDKIGIHVGVDALGASYIEISTIAAIDQFTALTEFSKKIFSPLPEDLFVGEKSLGIDSKNQTMAYTSRIYGTFHNDSQNIMDTTLCVGPYRLERYDKIQQIAFERNDDWFECSKYRMYEIPGVCYSVIDLSNDFEKSWNIFNQGMLDYVKIPYTKVAEMIQKAGVFETKADEVAKLNVNSCTLEQWDERFGPNGTISKNSNWRVKPWMSNSCFLDGVFFSINRTEFARKIGKTPSINYFANSYYSNLLNGESYNDTQYHKDAISDYEDVDDFGISNFGYDFEKAKNCFRNAIAELVNENKLVLGTREKPTDIDINIKLMNYSDLHSLGEKLKSYIEKAFNDESVCDRRVVMHVMLEVPTLSEDIYVEGLMKGQFDFSFGTFKGNHYDPASLMETMKSDNSSAHTFNWGPDTSIIDINYPIIYDDKIWSFDALWQTTYKNTKVDDGVIVNPGY